MDKIKKYKISITNNKCIGLVEDKKGKYIKSKDIIIRLREIIVLEDIIVEDNNITRLIEELENK
jgi:hypothetical protein